MNKKVLILDYSIDAFESPLIESTIPKGIEYQTIQVKTGRDIPERILRTGITHVIHTGSTLSIMDDAPFTNRVTRLIRAAVGREIWQMGICYGHQLLNKVLVGNHAVRKAPPGFEAGWKKVWFYDEALRLLKVSGDEIVWQHHFDEVVELPLWSDLLATNNHTHIQAFVNFDLKLLGTQFHPEFDEDKGNAFFRADRPNIEEQGLKVEDLIQEIPSFDSRKTFFEFFIDQ